MEDLFSQINEAIDIEYDSKNEEVKQTLELPLEDRIKKGDTITNLVARFTFLQNNVAGTNKKNVD